VDKNSESNSLARFEILRQIAISGAQGSDLSESVKAALVNTSVLIGLSAVRIVLWGETGAVALNVCHSDDDQSLAILNELEDDLFEGLRKKRKLRSAFLSFGGENPLSAFTVPLIQGQNLLGAAFGVKPNESGIIREDYFLESLAASITLAVVANHGASPAASGGEQERIDKARLQAVMETAVTVNHEINNPLTAALGNVQLLLMKSDELTPEVRQKLEIVEKSAMQIRDVTQRLLRLTEARSVNYAGDERMIDLGDSPDSAESSRKPPEKKD
jgi:signal transduction histidine kinase